MSVCSLPRRQECPSGMSIALFDYRKYVAQSLTTYPIENLRNGSEKPGPKLDRRAEKRVAPAPKVLHMR